MELLVTVDKNYIPPLQVMLTSLYMNNPGEDVELYLLGGGCRTVFTAQQITGKRIGAAGKAVRQTGI